MRSSGTSNDAKPSSDSASDGPYVIAHTTDGRPICLAEWPWGLPCGTWAERARVGNRQGDAT